MSSPLLVLRKPTGTIQLSNPFSLGERKLLNTLMYHAQLNSRPLGEEHEILVDDVYQALGWTRSKNVDKLKEYLRALLRTVIEWNEFGEDRKVDWQACQFLSSGAIRGQTLSYLINPKIVAELRNPVLYAKVQLLVQGKLSKRHSLVLYEYFQDALGRRLNVERVPLDLVISLLGLSGETYRQFKYLQRDVLKPSLHEINLYTDLTVSYRPVREGRQTVALDFEIRRDPSFQLSFDLVAPPGLVAGMAAVEGAGDAEEAGEDEEGALIAQLERHGVTRDVAEQLCTRHSLERVRAQVTLLEAQLAAGKAIENPGAWLRTAIRGNWAATRGAPAPDASTARQGGGADRPPGPGAREEKEFQGFRFDQARRAFAARSKTFQTRRRNAFVAAMESEGNTTVLNAMRRDGWENPMVNACFLDHGDLMANLLTEPHQRDIDAYLAWRVSGGQRRPA